jgi:hypothetical protein
MGTLISLEKFWLVYRSRYYGKLHLVVYNWTHCCMDNGA